MAEPNPPSDQPLTRAGLEALHSEGILDAAAFKGALSLWDQSRGWRAFTTRWLTILGAAFLLIGILFFFAYNWKDLGRVARFAILQGAVLLTALTAAWALRSETGRRAGELLLISASVLTGILIAVYGQTYQTGADAFQNFLSWAALILPWVIVGRSAPLWILWLAILETGMIFFWTQVMGPTGSGSFALLFLLLGLLTLGAALAREFLATKSNFTWLAHRPIRYFLGIATLTWLGISTVRFIFFDEFNYRDDQSTLIDALGFLLFAGAVGATFWWHRLRDYDLGALLLAALFGSTLAITALGRLLYEIASDLDEGFFLIMAIITLAVFSAAGVGLKKIHGAHRETPAS